MVISEIDFLDSYKRELNTSSSNYAFLQAIVEVLKLAFNTSLLLSENFKVKLQYLIGNSDTKLLLALFKHSTYRIKMSKIARKIR